MTDIIQLMAKNETMIGQLYRLYANRFPEEKPSFLVLPLKKTTTMPGLKIYPSKLPNYNP
ncbi:hypothetical protein KKB3_01129, partial [Dehalococcoides mccartyi]